MNRNRLVSPAVRRLACLLAVGLLAGPALGQTYTWTGGGGAINSWDFPSNWSPPYNSSGPPGDHLFSASGQAQPNVFVGGTFSISSLNFSGATASYNLFGPGTLNVSNGVSVSNTPIPHFVSANIQSSIFDVGTGGVLFALGSVNQASGGGFTKIGAGTLALGGTNTYSGTTTIQSGILQVGSGGTTGTLGTGNVVNTGILSFLRSDAITVPNAISGTGGLSKSGAGTTTLTGTNT